MPRSGARPPRRSRRRRSSPRPAPPAAPRRAGRRPRPAVVTSASPGCRGSAHASPPRRRCWPATGPVTAARPPGGPAAPGRGVLGVTEVAERGRRRARHRRPVRRGVAAGRRQRLPARAGRSAGRATAPGGHGAGPAAGAASRPARFAASTAPYPAMSWFSTAMASRGHGHVGRGLRRGAQRADALAARRHQGQRRRGRGEHAAPRRVPRHRAPPATAPALRRARRHRLRPVCRSAAACVATVWPRPWWPPLS